MAAAAPPELLDALGVYLDTIDEFAPGLVEGLYVVGSAALDDWQAGRSDIDVVAVTAEPASDEDAATIDAAHRVLADRLPAPDVDGPYVAWGDLVVEPATGLRRPWVLGREFHFDGDCFEINPVTWFTLSRYGLTARGPAAAELEVAVDLDARRRFVIDNLDTYWRAIGDQVAAAIGDRDLSASDLEWCVLGPLRLHVTATSGDVVSKRGAGQHGLAVAPTRLHGTIAAALDVRARGISGVADASDLAAVPALISWILADLGLER